MKNILWLALPFFLLTSACENCDPEGPVALSACSVDNPTEDLAWLREEIQNREQQPGEDLTQYLYIAQAEYEGETVFIYGNCCPNCNTIVPVFDCAGERIGLLGYGEEDIDFAIMEEAVAIWKPTDYSCRL